MNLMLKQISHAVTNKKPEIYILNLLIKYHTAIDNSFEFIFKDKLNIPTNKINELVKISRITKQLYPFLNSAFAGIQNLEPTERRGCQMMLSTRDCIPVSIEYPQTTFSRQETRIITKWLITFLSEYKNMAIKIAPLLQDLKIKISKYHKLSSILDDHQKLTLRFPLRKLAKHNKKIKNSIKQINL